MESLYDQVIRLRIKEGYGARRIEKLVPVGSSTISRWINEFEKSHGNEYISIMKEKLNTPELTPDEKEKMELRAEIARLKAQLSHEQLRADFYDEMITVAEAKFNIPIRKKAGTKQ